MTKGWAVGGCRASSLKLKDWYSQDVAQAGDLGPRAWAAPLNPINAPRTLLTSVVLVYLEPLKKVTAHFTQVFNLTTALWQLTDLYGSQIYKCWTAGFSPDQLQHHENNYSPQLLSDLDRRIVIATIFLQFTLKSINLKNMTVRGNQAIMVREKEKWGVLRKP